MSNPPNGIFSMAFTKHYGQLRTQKLNMAKDMKKMTKDETSVNTQLKHNLCVPGL